MFPLNGQQSLFPPELKEATSLNDIKKTISKIGLVSSEADAVVDAISSLSEKKWGDITAVTAVLWPTYASTVTKFCVQTTHVLLARALIYRIGEDQEAFPRLLSGKVLNDELTKGTSRLLEAPHPGPI